MSELFANIGLRKKVDHQLVNGGEALKGKLVAIYFSAHWCPPCRNFTPALKTFYEQLKAEGVEFEIVFVPFDRSEEDVKTYLAESHGSWYYIPFGSEHIQVLSKKYDISSIPMLIVIKPNGDVITAEGRSVVQSGKSPRAIIAEWNSGAK